MLAGHACLYTSCVLTDENGAFVDNNLKEKIEEITKILHRLPWD
jgi:hypothetical protein